MLIIGLGTYAATAHIYIYIVWKNTQNTGHSERASVWGWRDTNTEEQDEVPDMPQMFLQTNSSTGNWKKSSVHDVLE